jgi:hypothetical protein
MRFLSLIVGLVLGFLAAAWFYGAGGALTIAGRQIGPDIVLHEEVHSQGSGRIVEPGSAPPSASPGEPSDGSGSGANTPPSGSTANTPPSGVGYNSYVTLRWPK